MLWRTPMEEIMLDSMLLLSSTQLEGRMFPSLNGDGSDINRLLNEKRAGGDIQSRGST